jgi:uncharacterized membrane protein
MHKKRFLIMGAILLILLPCSLFAQVKIDLQLKPQIVKPGDAVNVMITLENPTFSVQIFNVWMMVYDPSGTHPVLFGPGKMKLGPGEVVTFTKVLRIPPKTKPGEYKFIAYCGMYPKEIWNYDTEILTVL